MKKLRAITGLGVTLKLALPAYVLAADLPDYPRDIIDTPEKVEALFSTVADWVFSIFLIVAVIGLIYTAFMYLTATGDPEKLKIARISLTFSIVAIVIALLAASMPALIENLLREGGGGTGSSGGTGSGRTGFPGGHLEGFE